MPKTSTAHRRKPTATRKKGKARAGGRAPGKKGATRWQLRKRELAKLKTPRLALPALADLARVGASPAQVKKYAPAKGGELEPFRPVATCKEARTHLALNQSEFAALLGKNDSTVENWESPNPKRRVTPPQFLQELFGAFLRSRSPRGVQLRYLVRNDGAVRAMYQLLRSAFDGLNDGTEHTVAPRELRRPRGQLAGGLSDERRAELQREVDEHEAWRAANPAQAAELDAATVVYKPREGLTR